MQRVLRPDWQDGHCVDLAADAIGRDVWAELGGRPGSWREAAALYRRLGARTLSEAVTKVLGDPIDPKMASRGDVVMVRGALGICRGEVAECSGATVPMREAEKAWRAT